MANNEHLALLEEGIEAWNAWRAGDDTAKPDLSGANLSKAQLGSANLRNSDLSDAELVFADLGGAHLQGANLHGAICRDANLRNADLRRANLGGTEFSDANLRRANLRNADLREASLRNANLRNANLGKALLSNANVRDAILSGANLSKAQLGSANLSNANLSGAILGDANLRRANFRGTNLRKVQLGGANLSNSDLGNADLREAMLGDTVFGNVDLTETKGLDRCHHHMASIVDYRTLERSSNVPLSFWRGCGLPDWQIATIRLYQPNLSQADINDVTDEIFRLRAEQSIQLYSCFISYSSKDRAFARRLHHDLQNAGVRCWFDEHDLKTGDRLRDAIDRAVRTRDKLLLIFSEASIASEWVENEVDTALEEERSSLHRKTILFPIRIDDAVMEAELAWARMIKRDRHITDMTGWNEEEAYQEGLKRLLRDLRADPEGSPPGA